ncbi:C6 finger domain-containing protein [Colletotrichum karsti]|uniref:C6 finger domain-containing protein n=1 Tax=Colletotrichum karsti TaxID=1095194 RepID=A0A9P6HXV4_9PEZI|nr:C6 finger domain-containing protein [Colletotrichum karsti]KAF9873252.1 C6 finger domain-containing protein [Colletotrichum karsti]
MYERSPRPQTTPIKASIDIHRYAVTKQQSPTAKTRLSSLVALIDRDKRNAFPKSNMAEALLGLATSSYDDAPSSRFSIAKPEDIPAQLLRDLELKKTPTRCEHVSVSLDVPNTVEFAIPENDADAPENIDPALGGFRSQIMDGQAVKVVRAYDVIIRQPQDDPVMQRAVARHIVGLLSTVDESSWVVREVSRGQHGWAFTYICKDSVAMWNRQNGKTASKGLIGEYSQKELDPVISARPAFDCRGTLTIAFVKNSRTINVKYEHTPLHKSVGEMIEHFRPLPPAPPPAPLIPAGDKKKTPRKKKVVELNEDGTPKEPTRKRKSVALNEDGTPKEPKRKRKSAAVNEGGTPVQPKKRRKKKSEAGAEAAADGAVAGEGSQQATVPTKADVAVQSGIHSQVNLNVPPGEASRRREVAIRLLSDSGVDPETLSTEQFSIFANQSPDLQKESLAMLVKYGAERLRIVHPADAAAAASSSTSASSTPELPPSQTETPLVADAFESPSEGKKKRRGGTSKQDDEELIPAPPGTPLRLVSRGGCIRCRINRLKCDRGKPACETCEEEELECQYPLVKAEANKRASRLSAAQVISDDDAEAEAEAEPESEPEPEPAPEPQEEPDDIETIDYTSNMPVANMLTPAAGTSNEDYFNSGPSDLSYTHASNDISMSHGVNSYSEPAATVNFTDHHATTTTYTQPSLTQTATYTQPASVDTNSYTQPVAAETASYTQPTTKSPKASRTSTRRSLPSGARSHTETAVPLPSYAQNWPMSPPKATNTVSPTMTTRQPRTRTSTQTPVQVPAASQQTSYDTTQQAAARAAIQQQQQHRPSPTPQVAQTVTPAQVSPFQAPVQTARAKSRAGQRASTRTPVNTEPRATPTHHTVQPSATMDTSTYNDSHSLSNTSNYNTYNTKYSGSTSSNAAADTRIAYEPYTAQTTSATTSTYPSYDDTYERTTTPVQNTSIAYTPTKNSRSGQYQTRSSGSYSNTTAPAASSYSQTPTTTQQQTASLQSFNMRASATANHARSSSNKYQQQQSQQQQPQQTQPYGSYSTQSQQQAAAPDQHSWYGFGSSGASSTPTNTSGGYATRNSASNAYGNTANANQAYQQQQQQYGSLNMPGHNYAGGDNDMYELLKLHNSGR